VTHQIAIDTNALTSTLVVAELVRIDHGGADARAA
jgi:hypothetical protein